MKGSSVSVGTLLDRKGRGVFSIAPDASVYSAIEQMADRGIGALVVLGEGRLLGILSERDYTRKVILAGRSSRETAVGEIMSTGLLTVGPLDDVAHCLRVMTENRVRHLPVVANGAVVGVLSIGDLVKQVIAEQEDTIDQLHSYIAGAYPS
ncbi:MAG TPA: CBS domain-containing protein [Bryobacteraceae bacterium]|nr:CBS domain-containing protein [Bryobacteraceae bacterium]